MSTDKDKPAAPSIELHHDGSMYNKYMGLTAREHAAIALRVPDSGNEWLDAMIRTAQRNDLAARAMAAFIAGIDNSGGVVPVDDGRVAERAREIADAMLSASAAHSAEGE